MGSSIILKCILQFLIICLFVSFTQATSANQPPPSEVLNEEEIEALTEQLVTTHQQKTTLLLSREQEEVSKSELEDREKTSLELTSEIEGILGKVLEDLVVEGSMDTESSEKLVQTFAEKRAVIIKDHQAMKQRQLSRLSHRMTMKKKERKQQLLQKQANEKKEVK